MQTASLCSAMGCQAVQGVREVGEGYGPSIDVTVHRELKSQLLPSKRRTAAVDDTISNGWLLMQARRITQAHAAQDSSTDHSRAAGLAFTHVLCALEAQERQQARAILSRAAPLTESAQLGGAPAADHVLAVKKLRCGRGAQ